MFFIECLGVFSVLLFSLSAGYYPFYLKGKNNAIVDFPIGESLAAGVFLGAGLIHMLGDANASFEQLGYHYPLAFLLAGLMFLLLLLLEHIGKEWYCHADEGGVSYGFAFLATAMLSIHSFLAGSALGLSDSFSLFSTVLLAILAHKWVASFALAVQINKSPMCPKCRVSLFLIFVMMVPLGFVVGHLISEHFAHLTYLEPIFNALAAGTFLYLGTLHGLKQAVLVKACCNLRYFNFVIIGFIIMAVVAIWT